MKGLMLSLITALFTFAIGTAASMTWKAYQLSVNQTAPELLTSKGEQPERGSLKWHVQQAKARGEKEFVTGELSCGMEVSSLNEALANYSVIVAQLIEKRTYAEKHGLYTWYKFKVLETLSRKPLPYYSQWSSYVSPPFDLLPVGADEILMQGADGSMVIDSVKVIQHSNSPDYSPFKRYVLFVELDSSRRLAAVPWPDEIGIFTVDEGGIMKATDHQSHNLKDQMAKRFGNSLELLRLHLESRPSAKAVSNIRN